MSANNIQTATVETIETIRSKSKRPGADLIINTVTEKQGLSVTDVQKNLKFMQKVG